MKVSVIIVNFNTAQYIENLLSSIFKFTSDIEFEIIIVDNFSTDRSIDEIPAIYPGVQLVNCPYNAGFGTANNIGSRYATGEFLFFLNPDTLLRSNAIKELYDFYNSNEPLKIGALGTLLRDNKMQPNASYSEKFITFSDEIIQGLANHFLKSRLRKEREENRAFKEVAWVSGADLFIKSKIFEDIGGFDEKIFMYYEETDLQLRLRQSGFKSYILFSPRIIHLEGGSFQKELSLKQKKIIDKSKLYYYKKHKNGSFLYMLNKKIYLLMTFLNLYFKFGTPGVKEYKSYLRS